ncbi:Sec-independent protein translocase subunit TatA/TatB [Rhabdothermincola salaria]|uniref:Sec-independent protein translocase subunit TatA/TatB n=1 Tax=Rhabdothermincola salaria TaxID=2903142 RepID=UPI001E310EAE|nr:twin-arginine translocase TatA/TatE family subunit [Rhabdothermincola salaria]
MFNVGGGEILVILLIALLFLGPERMPDAAKKLGRFLGEARRMTAGFQEEVRSAMDLSGTDDAVQRSDAGPRLIGPPPEPTAPRTPEGPADDGDATEVSPPGDGRDDSSAA